MIMCVLLCYPVSIRIYYQQGGLFLVSNYNLLSLRKNSPSLIFISVASISSFRMKFFMSFHLLYIHTFIFSLTIYKSLDNLGKGQVGGRLSIKSFNNNN